MRCWQHIFQLINIVLSAMLAEWYCKLSSKLFDIIMLPMTWKWKLKINRYAFLPIKLMKIKYWHIVGQHHAGKLCYLLSTWVPSNQHYYSLKIMQIHQLFLYNRLSWRRRSSLSSLGKSMNEKNVWNFSTKDICFVDLSLTFMNKTFSYKPVMISKFIKD